MGGLAKRVVFGVLGVAVMLCFWTVKGWFVEDANATVAHIPDKVWDGGGGTVVLEVETSDPARFSASFETNLQIDDADHKYLDTWERVGAGLHTYTIDVPNNVSGTVEAGIDDPKVGARVRVAVKVDGRTVAEDSQVLTEPLQQGYGFFAQVELEDYVKGTLSED
ncbi:MAG TPA: hypothetical protein VJV75_10925 [Candidatus Polarisedimenticolia bacterium]|nr:hypothetical protein [Candidatus Polarisedimenticolia bacterium]